MAAPVATGARGASTTGSGPLSAPAPSGVVDGDLLIAWFTGDVTTGTVTHTDPSGNWTPITGDLKGGATAGASGRAWWKVAASEGSTIGGFTRTGGSGVIGLTICRVTGADSAPIDVSASATFDSGDQGTTPDVTTTGADRLILRMSAWDEGKTLTAVPSGCTTLQHNDLSSHDNHMCWENQASAGSVGAESYTLSSGTRTVNVTVAIKGPSGGATVNASVIAATTVVHAQTTAGGAVVSASVVASTTDIHAEAAHGGATVAPSSLAATTSMGVATAAGGSVVAASVIAATTVVHAQSAAGGATVNASVIAPTVEFHAATVDTSAAGATVNASVIAATVTIHTQTVAGGGTVAAAVVAGTTEIHAETTVGGATVTPGVVAATVEMHQQSVHVPQEEDPYQWVRYRHRGQRVRTKRAEKQP